MKRLHTGLILLNRFDIVCISVSVGSSIGLLVKLYKKRKQNRSEDPIIVELKEKSPITMLSANGKLLRAPLLRGGDKPKVKTFSLLIKNQKLANLLLAIVTAKKNQKRLKLLSDFFFLLNNLL